MFLFSTPRRLCAPWRPRLLMVSLALSALLTAGLDAPPAHAGSYILTGTSTYTGSTVTPAAAATSSPCDGTATASVTPMSPDGIPTYTLQASPGTFTDTFTWTHDNAQQDNTTDPPPTCVLMEQTSSATWCVRNEWGTGTGDGKPDCGLSGGTVTTSTYGGNGPSVSLSAILCTQQSGASFSASCSPTASFTGTTGTNGLVSGQVLVSGGASVYPITLTIGGTKDPAHGDYHVLTGQQITATLSGIPANYKVTKYAWSGVSGTCFKTYNETALSNQLVPLVDADKSGSATGSNTVPALAFYDSAAESLTVTCTVTVLAPDDKATVTLTATSPAINVLKPTVSWNIYTGYVQPYGTTKWGLEPDPTTTYSEGEDWENIIISVPSPFSGGSGCIAQLTTPDRETYKGTNASPTVPNNKLQGLDGGFPYGNIWAVPTPSSDGDSPVIIIQGGNPNGTLSKLTANDSYTTWVMYEPTGGVWVPLQSYTWTWSGTVSWLNSTWTLTAGNPANKAAEPHYKGTDTPTPPVWTLVH